jgi:hypothetical protein
MSAALRIIAQEKAYTVALQGNVVLVLFRAGPTEARMVASWDTAMAEVARTGRKAAWFGVIELESVPPEEATRQAFARFFERHRDEFEVFAIAFEGTGFRAAMTRTVISAVMSALQRSRFTFPRHVCSTAEEALALAQKSSPGLDVAGVLTALRGLRAAA